MSAGRNKPTIEHSVADRIVLLILSPIIAPILGVLVYFFYAWPVKDPVAIIVKYVLFDIFLSFLIFVLLCFAWAVAGPRRMNRLITIAYSKALLALTLLAVGTLLTLLCVLCEVYL
jgi:RsiW-degrading membrane proteinase PrsW (M82 family)